jgi:hypothetical protein
MGTQVELTTERSVLEGKVHEHEAEVLRSRATQSRLSQVMIFVFFCIAQNDMILLLVQGLGFYDLTMYTLIR